MKSTKLLIALLMMTTSLSGCLHGDSSVDTNNDGNDPNSLPDGDGNNQIGDEWDVYYVDSGDDLPACGSTTLGRLYYVASTAGFETCTSTGWAFVGHTGKILTGSIVSSQKLSFEDRRDNIRHSFVEVIDEVRLNESQELDVIAIEDPYSVGIGRAKDLSTIRSTIEEVGLAHGLPYLQVTPNEWHGLVYETVGFKDKKNVKKLAQEAASDIARSKLTSDEADAFWVALYCLRYAGRLIEK